MLLFKGTLHGVYWILLKTPTKFSRVNPSIQKYSSRSRYSKIRRPTEVNTFGCILPTQLYQLPALTTAEVSSSSLAAAGFIRALARPWYPAQTTKPAIPADSRFTMLKPGVGRAEGKGEGPEPSQPTAGCAAASCKERSGDCSVPDPVVAELALLGLVQVNGAGWCLVQIRRGRGSGHLIIRLLVARGGTDRSCKESAAGGGQRGAAPSGAGPAAPGPRRGEGPRWAAAASAPCPLFTAAAAVNNASPGRGRRGGRSQLAAGTARGPRPPPAGMGRAPPRERRPRSRLCQRRSRREAPGGPPAPRIHRLQPPRLRAREGGREAGSILRTAAGSAAPRLLGAARPLPARPEPQAALRERRSISARALPDPHGRTELPSPGTEQGYGRAFGESVPKAKARTELIKKKILPCFTPATSKL